MAVEAEAVPEADRCPLIHLLSKRAWVFQVRGVRCILCRFVEPLSHASAWNGAFPTVPFSRAATKPKEVGSTRVLHRIVRSFVLLPASR